MESVMADADPNYHQLLNAISVPTEDSSYRLLNHNFGTSPMMVAPRRKGLQLIYAIDAVFGK
jgi:hypothetical protein